MINKITYHNFGLLKNVELIPDKINLISGINKDNPNESGNGSGKSTIINGIIFAKYGDVPDINLADVVSDNEKVASVILEEDNLIVTRDIPTNVNILDSGNDVQANTNKLKQDYLNKIFGNYDTYKKYHCLDNKKGIDLLQLGNVALKKNLMEFLEGDFNQLRTKLLEKKNNCERFNKDKRVDTFHLSSKRLEILKEGYMSIEANTDELNKEIKEQQQTVNKTTSEISAKERIKSFKEQEIKKLNGGKCPLLSIECKTLLDKMEDVQVKLWEEIHVIDISISQLKEQLEPETSYLNTLQKQMSGLNQHKLKIQRRINQLESAFKFQEYQFTNKDIELHQKAIKVIDDFSSYYIMEWLRSLEIIVNDLLRTTGMNISFNADKSFMNINDNGKVRKYSQISSGQKTMLGIVFKLAMLIHIGETDGNIIIDDGINDVDMANFIPLIEIFKNTNFQYFIVYQNAPNIEGVKNMRVIRKGEVSTID